MKERFALMLVVFSLAIGFVPDVQAQDERLAAMMSDPASLKTAMEKGRKISTFCANCHGDSGVSKIPAVPNLGGQNPDYVLEQTRRFGDGRRQDAFMQGLIRILTEDEKTQLAIFYSNQDVPPNNNQPTVLVDKGRALFTRLCARCHLPTGHGSMTIPRLAGQHPEYVIMSVSRYRDNTGVRRDPLMSSAVAQMKDDDIKAVAAYVATLP
ncbi:MAG: c-type cytochrome [Zoogloeaceae bacterium]|jgi:cytochrome c553|nr:c-type cytochrome [Zoogloeaceae bacterium]